MMTRRACLGIGLQCALSTRFPALAMDTSAGDAAIARAIHPIRADFELPGLIAAIVRPGRPLRVAAVGVRKVGSREAFRPEDRVHLGSCTKAMTATMIASLVRDGKLSWASTLRETFPAVALADEVGSIRLDQLLTHRSGLPANLLWSTIPGKTPRQCREAALSRIAKRKLGSEPGTKFLYSNLGYVLAGLMAETVADSSWEDLMRRRVFEPLGMTSSGFGPPGAEDRSEQPWGHRPPGRMPEHSDNPPVMGPAGTVHAAIADWARFVELHLAGARGEPTAILSPASFHTLQAAPAGSSHAMGWIVGERPWAGGRVLTHNGSNTIWMASAWLAPARNVAFLAVTNLGGPVAEKALDEVVSRLIDVPDG